MNVLMKTLLLIYVAGNDPLSAIPVPETHRNRYETLSKHRRPYRMAFPNLETLYGMADNVSKAFQLVCQPFRWIFFGFLARLSGKEGRGSLKWQKIPSLTTNKILNLSKYHHHFIHPSN